MINIGQRIKELRTENGWTQKELSNLVGVSQKAIDYWERNINEPKIGYFINLLKAFDITYDEFFDE